MADTPAQTVTAEALADVTIAQAQEALGIGRTALYQRMERLQIAAAKRPDGRAYLTAEQLEQLRTFGAAAQLARRPTAAAAEMLAAAARAADPSAVRPDSADGEQLGTERERLELQALRLQVIREALELGAPLTTATVTDLLGARPGGAEVIRGRIAAVREGRDCWTLERLEIEPAEA